MYDYVVLGGGIVGLSTAWQLCQRQPEKKILLLEKESQFASHQTAHNSGVIHAGIYYPPDSLKAKFCRAGAQATIKFCQQHNIDYQQCGKLLVATNPEEHQRMLALYQRAKEHQLPATLLNREQLKQREPNIVGSGAIYVSGTGIVNYRKIAIAMAKEIQRLGGETQLNSKVIKIREASDHLSLSINNKTSAQSETIKTRFLVCCSGLLADRTTKMLNIKTDFQIIPYRGEYYRLAPSKSNITKHLIYPIPDPALPFLGVHLTKMIDGSITVGPNAVQGWKREGYGAININIKDLVEMLSFPGFWKVSLKHLKTGIKELKNSWSTSGYLKQVQKYCPSINYEDLEPHPAGVRAQAVLRDGTLVHDFLFAESPRSIHVCNAPSPAATSAIPIGEYICNKILEKVNAEE